MEVKRTQVDKSPAGYTLTSGLLGITGLCRELWDCLWSCAGKMDCFSLVFLFIIVCSFRIV